MYDYQASFLDKDGKPIRGSTKISSSIPLMDRMEIRLQAVFDNDGRGGEITEAWIVTHVLVCFRESAESSKIYAPEQGSQLELPFLTLQTVG